MLNILFKLLIVLIIVVMIQHVIVIDIVGLEEKHLNSEITTNYFCIS